MFARFHSSFIRTFISLVWVRSITPFHFCFVTKASFCICHPCDCGYHLTANNQPEWMSLVARTSLLRRWFSSSLHKNDSTVFFKDISNAQQLRRCCLGRDSGHSRPHELWRTQPTMNVRKERERETFVSLPRFIQSNPSRMKKEKKVSLGYADRL